MRGCGVLHGRAVGILQNRIEGKLNLIPDGHVAARLALVIQMAALQIAEVAEVVDRFVAPPDFERPFAGARQSGALLEQRIKKNALPRIAFAPHAEIAREFLPQNVPGLRIGLNGKPERRGRSRVYRALNAFAELLA